MLIQSAKVAKKKKKLICEKGHVETDFLGINNYSTYKNLSKDTNYGTGCRRSHADFEKSNCVLFWNSKLLIGPKIQNDKPSTLQEYLFRKLFL